MADEAAANAAPAVEWWLARAAGASVSQAVALAAWGASALLAGAMATRATDGGQPLASFDEVADAASSVAPYPYLLARQAGLSHSEALVAARADVPSVEAAIARFAKEEVLEALASGVAPEDYVTLRHVTTHTEALEAGSLGVGPADYVLAAGAGASHAEIVEAVRSGSNLWDYARRRNLGLSARSGQPA
jgi:hypothetical protein